MQQLIFGIILIIMIPVIRRIIKFMNEEIVNKSKPPIPSKIQIVEVEIRSRDNGIKQSIKNSIDRDSLYDITFEFPNGDKRVIIVPVEGNNNWICEGVKGILTLQGSHFINFEKTE